MSVSIAILDVDTAQDPAYLRDVAEAIQVQVTRDFSVAPPRGHGIDALVRAITTPADRQPGEWLLSLVSTPEVADALGYHDVLDDGTPALHVYPTLLDDPTELPVVCSHEILEALKDPECTEAIVCPDGLVRADEACDAVERASYPITCASGRVVRVSDFVLPPYFAPPADMAGLRYDFLGLITEPCTLLPGGYESLYEGGIWTQRVEGSQSSYRRRVADACVSRSVRRAQGTITVMHRPTVRPV